MKQLIALMFCCLSITSLFLAGCDNASNTAGGATDTKDAKLSPTQESHEKQRVQDLENMAKSKAGKR